MERLFNDGHFYIGIFVRVPKLPIRIRGRTARFRFAMLDDQPPVIIECTEM